MKKILLFCFFLSIFFAEAQTSVYHPFPDSNAVWIVSSGCCICCCGSSVQCCDFTTRYDITGDTIISSKSYHKISSIGTYSCTGACGPCMSPGWGVNYIREDTLKRIWMFQTSLMTDTLLYDFNLNIGDTIKTCGSNILPGLHYIVQSIDSILIGTDYRKKYNYSNSDTCTKFLIEGIGSGAGLFSPLCGNACFERSFKLSCFKQNGNILFYPTLPFCSPDISICDFAVSIPDIKSDSIFFISPNPATTEVTINFSKATLCNVQLTNTLGEMLDQVQINSSSLTLDVSRKPKGIYFVAVTDEQGNRVVRKVVKM